MEECKFLEKVKQPPKSRLHYSIAQWNTFPHVSITRRIQTKHTNTHMHSYSFVQKAIEKQQAHTQGARGQCIYITLFQTKAELRKQRLEEKPSHFNSVFCSWNSAFILQSLTQNYKDSIHTQRLKAQRTLDTI